MYPRLIGVVILNGRMRVAASAGASAVSLFILLLGLTVIFGPYVAGGVAFLIGIVLAFFLDG